MNLELQRQAIDLRQQLKNLSQAFLLLERSEVCCCGMTLSQCNLLLEVSQQEEGLPSSEVASELGLDLSTVSRVADGLVRQNMLRKEAGLLDRRQSILSLTADGRERVNDINDNMKDLALAVLERIPAEKRPEVLESLSLIAEALNNLKGGQCLG